MAMIYNQARMGAKTVEVLHEIEVFKRLLRYYKSRSMVKTVQQSRKLATCCASLRMRVRSKRSIRGREEPWFCVMTFKASSLPKNLFFDNLF